MLKFAAADIKSNTGAESMKRTTFHKMSARPSKSYANMQSTIEMIETAAGQLKQDDSLLFLNHILAVRRGFVRDHNLEANLATLSEDRPLAYVVHFIAKQLLMHASIVGRYVLTWPKFIELMNMVTALKDPCEDDPDWKHSDPTAFFERISAQQLTSQDRKMIQKYGLALGLFRDVGIVDGFDLRKEIENTLGMSIEEFMSLGFVCGGLRCANLGLGTFTPEYLTDAFVQGIEVCTPELWRPFLDRTCCTPQQFRQKQSEYASSLYPQFEFNALFRFPIVEVMRNRFLAIDPELLVERSTLGLLYDVFERDRTRFSNKFGRPFETFVGMLLRSVCSHESLWSHAEWQEAKPVESRKVKHKVCDWAYIAEPDTILFECKSLRPSLDVTTVPNIDPADNVQPSIDPIEHTTERIVESLRQMVEHNERIRRGEWIEAGIPKRDATAFVLVVYGHFQTVNAPIWRDHITKRLNDLGLQSRPFVVLSLSDLDSVACLVESGHSLTDVIVQLSSRDKSLHDYAELRDHAVSRATMERGREFLDQIRPH
jgi:hypothetical protein